MTSRRSFIATTAAVASSVAASRALALVPPPSAEPRTIPAPGPDPYSEELPTEALSAARDAGASYADVRIGRYRRQNINTRERAVTGVSDSESYGIGIRTIVNGLWVSVVSGLWL